MSQIDDIRVEMSEYETSMKSDDLADSMKELDARVMDANTWSTITYSGGYISQIDFFSDSAKTNKTIQKVFSRTTGTDGINYISGIVTTTYNDNGSVDSTITTSITRTDNKIVGCASVFSSSEVLV